MPCTGGGVPYPPSKEELLEALASPLLCAVMRSFETASGKTQNEILAGIDWKEAGVTPEQWKAWWNMHKKIDAERKVQERRAVAKAAKDAKKKRKPSAQDEHFFQRAVSAISTISMLYEEIEGYKSEIRSKALKEEIDDRLANAG